MQRRNFMRLGGAAGVVLLAQPARLLAQEAAEHATDAPARPRPVAPRARPPIVAPGGQIGVVTPNGSTLPMRTVDGVKVGHLVASEIEHEFTPGLTCRVWGYNGSTPGPTIEVTEGDRVRIYVTNRLPEPTTVHWHGIVLPNGMDGVSALNQAPIPPGETWVYEFELRYPGTFMYHSHYDEMTQIALGCVGMFVVHPRRARGPAVDRDFVLLTHEWTVDVGTSRPDASAMNDFNVLTFNGKIFPATEPLVVGTHERVRIRLGNLSPMDHHPIHLHGLWFEETATDGGYIPESARRPETTVLVPVGATRVIELVPTEPGDWAMHCHMTHHVMSQMGHGLPSMVGVDARAHDARMSRVVPGYMSMGTTGMGGMGDMGMPIPPNSVPMRGGPGPFGNIDMGGMVTVLKVRDEPDAADPAGWYEQPEGTRPARAETAALTRDGIDVDATGAP
jgi:FtsP/CotA-like multicopper oxidase with cupredoxin domain